METVQEAPRSLSGIARQLGPGLIITASIVGSGELIMTTQVGAAQGFTLLWFIIAGCIIKVFVQIELGRYAIVSGETTLGALNRVPGPRLGPNWLVYLWLMMYISLFFQLGGILGAIAAVFQAGGLPLDLKTLALLVTLSCSVLLALGHYRLVEQASALMVATFTFLTVAAVLLLNRTEYAISFAELRDGLRFRLSTGFVEAFAAFGIIGVGASELIYYPYWCLEKGYARRVGPYEPTADWEHRARGWMRIMQIDAWVSMMVYTTSTVAFYLLGAAILHRKHLVIDNNHLVETLSNIYQTSLGAWGMLVFLIGAFAVLYSTIFISTASNARLLVDAVSVFGNSFGARWVGMLAKESVRKRCVWWACILLPAIYLLIWNISGEAVTLVRLGGISQGIMLPFLSFAALYLMLRRIPPALRPGPVWSMMVIIAALSMTAVGMFTATSYVWKPAVKSVGVPDLPTKSVVPPGP